MASAQGAGAGLRYMAVWVLDANGYPLVEAPSADPTVPARMRGAKAFTPNFPDGQIIQFTGDDMSQGQINLPPTELSNIELRVGINNLDVDAVLQGINTVALAGGKIMGRETSNDGCLADVLILGYQQAIDKDPTSATYGNTVWHYYLVPKAQVRPYGGPMEEGNAGESRYVATPQKVARYPWGIAFTDVIEGFTEATTLEGFLTGAPMLAGWLGDDYETEFVLDPAALTADNVKVYHVATGTGVVTDVTATVTITTALITFAAPVAADDLIFAFYPTAEGC